jgi:hypothetical protein
MNNESDWVADVRRWCLAGAQAKLAASTPSAGATPGSVSDLDDVGYEAAHPALQSRHWPDESDDASAGLR